MAIDTGCPALHVQPHHCERRPRRSRVAERVVSIVLFLLCATPALAQKRPPLADLELEDLMKLDVQSVFGASKFLQKVTDAPAAVSVVTARDIEVYGYRTLADIIRSAPGFNVTYDRNYSYVGVRGFQRAGDYNSRILMLIDGHRANDPIYSQAYVGTEFPIDVELIDRVELIRGPSSSIYGTNAFLAVINVVMKRGKASHGVRLSADGGSLETRRARAVVGHTFASGLDVSLSASLYRSRGQKSLYYADFDDPATNNGIAANLDRDAAYHVFGSLSFKGLSFQGVYGWRAKQVPTASFGVSFNDERSRVTDAQGWADVSYLRDLPGRWHFTGRVYHDRTAYNGRYPYDAESGEPSTSVSGDYANAGWWGTEVDMENVVAKRHKVTVGAQYRDNFRLNQGVFDVASGATSLDDRRNSHESAIFVEDQYTVNDKLLLNMGIRTDRYQAFGSTTNPRLALIFKPAENTAIKTLWGTAFRAPNAYELYYSSDVIVPSPNLEPESIGTAEIVLERYFAAHYRFSTSVYSSRVRNLISQVPNPEGMLIFLNVDSAATRGVEAEFEGKWRSGISSRISYSHQDSRNLVTDIPLANSVRHLATANITLSLIRHQVHLGMDFHFVGSVKTLDGAFTDRFVVPNVTMTTREFGNGLSLSASVYNLLDNKYGYPGGDEHRQDVIYQDGRAIRVGLKYSWLKSR
jgi:outer membrane receptor for ferrienterochelin and colicins